MISEHIVGLIRKPVEHPPTSKRIRLDAGKHDIQRTCSNMFALFRSVLFFSPPRFHECLIMIYSRTKRLLNQQRWNRCFLTLLSPCSITLQQMRCQKKWIEMCFIAPLSPSANGFNYLTKIVSLWKSEKMISQVSSGQVPNLKPRQAHAQPITRHYFFKLALISCSCLAVFPCSNKHKPGKIECSDFIITLPPFLSSLSLFFWVFWALYKPILSLALQLWVRPVSGVTSEKHVSPSFPSRSQPEHSSSVFTKGLSSK